MGRREFPAKVKWQAFERAEGCCEQCHSGRKLLVGDIFYDHRIPDGLGGEPTLANCQVLCLNHHDIKTHKHDMPAIAKTNRIRKRQAGIRKPRTITGWRKFNGEIVHVSRER